MNKEKHISFTFNFNAPVGQNIAHVDKIEAHFDKDMSMQVVDTKGLVEAPQVDFKERNNEGNTFEIPESVKECFRFASEFVKEQVAIIIKDFYLNKPVNLAIIERVLFDHNILQKSNTHTTFICALMDWGILPEDIDIRKTANGMATKFKSFPQEGYKKWNNDHLNDRTLCINIGNRLPESMKYNRNE